MSDAERTGSTQPMPDTVIRDQLRDYQTIAGINPSAGELLSEIDDLLDSPEETTERRVRQTFNYILKRHDHPHQQEWKDAKEAVLGLLSEVRKHQEGEA